jgi:hypothetical protein
MLQPTKLSRIVILCLLLAAVGLALAKGGLLRSVATYGVFLLCPLMHIGMMLFMGHGRSHDHGDNGIKRDEEEGGATSCH